MQIFQINNITAYQQPIFQKNCLALSKQLKKREMNFLKSLIGGQMVKGYSVSGEPMTGFGHHKMWKVYKGKKDSTGTTVSVFVLEKKQLKQNRQSIIRSAKKQVSNLMKIRHPGVLAVVQPLNEDQNLLTFVTEKIQGNLASLIRQNKIQEWISSQLELKLNMFPLLETITFLQDIVKQCHLGISLESIYVTDDGKWKVAGMNYCQQITGDSQTMEEFQSQFFDYGHCAPELLNQTRGKFNKYSDSFSVGLLLINLMTVIKKAKSSFLDPVLTKQQQKSQLNRYKDFQQFPALLQSANSQQLMNLLRQLLTPQNAHYRLSINNIQNCKWINDEVVLTVKYLEKISNYQNKQQLQFLRGLAGVVDSFQGKILQKRIIPNLTNLLKFTHLIPSVLYILLDIIKKQLITVQIFRKIVWPDIRPITQGKEMTAHSLYLLVSNLETLEKYLTEQDFMNCFVPLYLKCFDCPPKLKILALKNVQRLSKKFDYQFTKTKIVPKLVNTLKDDKIQIRKDALKVVYSIITRLDPQTILNVVLNGLQNCRKAGADSFVNTITVEIYNKITLNMSAQILATKIMPGIMNYLVDPTIEKFEFNLYKSALLKMLNKIEGERTKTWGNSTGNGSPKNHFDKYTEKDFILEDRDQKMKIQKKDNNKFDFLTDYKEQTTSNSQNNFINSSQTNQTISPSYNTGITFQFGQQNINQNINQSAPKISQNFGVDFGGFTLTPNSQDKKQNVSISLQQSSAKKAQKTNNEFDFSSFSESTTKTSEYQLPKTDFAFTNQSTPSLTTKNSQKTQANKDFEWLQNQNNSFFNGNSKTTYEPPSRSFGGQNKQISWEFSRESKVEKSQKQKNNLPFSPSSQPTTQDQKSANNPGSSPKKLVGPQRVGLKKPPKYNEFNKHIAQENIKKQSNTNTLQQKSNSFGDIQFPNIGSNLPNNSMSKKETKEEFNFGSKIPNQQWSLASDENNDDPFAEVEKEYGIKKTTNGANDMQDLL